MICNIKHSREATMARNAHPEVTRTRILDAAQRLFMA